MTLLEGLKSFWTFLYLHIYLVLFHMAFDISFLKLISPPQVLLPERMGKVPGTSRNFRWQVSSRLPEALRGEGEGSILHLPELLWLGRQQWTRCPHDRL